MEIPTKRTEAVEKRGAGKKNTVHLAREKNSDLYSIELNSNKLVMGEVSVHLGKPTRTLSTDSRGGITASSMEKTLVRTAMATLDFEKGSMALPKLTSSEALGSHVVEEGRTLENVNSCSQVTTVARSPNAEGNLCMGINTTTGCMAKEGTLVGDIAVTEIEAVPKEGYTMLTGSAVTIPAISGNENQTHRAVLGKPFPTVNTGQRNMGMGYTNTRSRYVLRGASRGRSKGPVRRIENENGMAGVWMEKGSRNAVQQGRTFASLMNSNPMDKKLKLSYVQPGMNGDHPAFFPQENDILEAKKKWEDYLVGYFISGSMAPNSVETVAKGYWGKLGLGKVLADPSGFYFFQLPDMAVRRKILEEGPWLFYGRNLVLQQWTPELVLCKETHDKIPLWVRFHKVPLTLWTGGGLSGIASLVGKPLYADSYTENMTKIAFARICIEVDANRPLPDSVQVCMTGKTIDIAVDYQWKPLRCSKCEVFGHVCKITPTDSQLTENRQAISRGKAPMIEEDRPINEEDFTMVHRRRKSKAGITGENGNESGNHANTKEIGWEPDRRTQHGINPTMMPPPQENNAKGVTLDFTDNGSLQTNDQPHRIEGMENDPSSSAPSSSVPSSSASSSSEDSSTDDEKSEHDINNTVEDTGNQEHYGVPNHSKNKHAHSKETSQILKDGGAQTELTPGQVVAAMPNTQFQEKQHRTPPKKNKKSSGNSKASKPRRR